MTNPKPISTVTQKIKVVMAHFIATSKEVNAGLEDYPAPTTFFDQFAAVGFVVAAVVAAGPGRLWHWRNGGRGRRGFRRSRFDRQFQFLADLDGGRSSGRSTP